MIPIQTILKLTENKRLTKTTESNIYEGENLADSLLFLFPPEYNSHPIQEYSISLHWYNENSEGDVHLFEFEEELYGEEYVQSIVNITDIITSTVGKITLWIELSDVNTGLLLKSDETTLLIQPHSDSAEHMPEAVPQIFNEYKVQMEQLINTATIIQDKIAETEARLDEKIAVVMAMMEEWEGKYGTN